LRLEMANVNGKIYKIYGPARRRAPWWYSRS
jgi:hypothetical protein